MTREDLNDVLTLVVALEAAVGDPHAAVAGGVSSRALSVVLTAQRVAESFLAWAESITGEPVGVGAGGRGPRAL